jgi:hypothetical protein
MIGDHDAIVVIFSEQLVRHCKTAHFLKTFGLDCLPEGPELAAMMGKFQFLVEGWDDDPQELYSIPEVLSALPPRLALLVLLLRPAH